MNGIGRLGELYGLSPATMAGLAQIRGAQPPPAETPPPVDPDSPEAWQAAATAAGAPGGVITDTSGSPNPLARSNPNSPPAIAAGVKPDNPAAAEAAAQQRALVGATPQGPAEDDFPTVKPMDQSASVGPGAPGAPVAPSYVVPAHWQPGSHTVGVQHGLDPEAFRLAREESELGAQHAGAAADARREAAVRAGQADALYAAGHQMASEEAARKLAQINQERDAYVNDQQKKFDSLSLEAQKKVDPQQFWRERGSGAAAMAAIMIGLNQFGVMWSGRGQNVALQMIDSAIDKNIAAQQANIGNARAALGQQESLYARNLAVFGDRERATLATKAQYLDQVAAMADQKRAEAKTPEAEAGYHDAMAKIYKDRTDLAARFGQLTTSQYNEQMNEHFVPPQVVGGGTGAGEKGKEDRYVPTLGGYVRSKEEAIAINNKASLRMQIGENMRQINQLLEKAKGLSSVTDPLEMAKVQREIDMRISDTLTKNTVLEGQGSMSEGDKDVAAEAKGLKGISIRGMPNTIISGYQSRIRQSATNMLIQHRLEGEAHGLQKGTEQYIQGPNGPTPVQRLEGRNAPISKRTQGYDDLVTQPKGVAK